MSAENVMHMGLRVLAENITFALAENITIEETPADPEDGECRSIEETPAGGRLCGSP